MSIYHLVNKLNRNEGRYNGSVGFSSNYKSLSHRTFYDTENDFLEKEKPWIDNPTYFKTAFITSLALMKMTQHASSGGTIEVMGMMTGKIIKGAIIVSDAYALPVEGTETRVNAQAEGYEYMVQYLDTQRKIGREENIVGWYHSHPGYGCWLSGIDVSTQKLNQDFQDPYLAVVIDPLNSLEKGKVDIGAFRTYPDSYKDDKKVILQNMSVPQSKQTDFGAHSEKYYPLDVKFIKSETEEDVLSYISSKSWMSNLLKSKREKIVQMQDINDNALLVLEKFKKFQPINSSKLQEAELEKFNPEILKIIENRFGGSTGFTSTGSNPIDSRISPLSSDNEVENENSGDFKSEMVLASNESMTVEESPHATNVPSTNNLKHLSKAPRLLDLDTQMRSNTVTPSHVHFKNIEDDLDVEMEYDEDDENSAYEVETIDSAGKQETDDILHNSAKSRSRANINPLLRKASSKDTHPLSTNISKYCNTDGSLNMKQRILLDDCTKIRNKELDRLLLEVTKLDLFHE